MSSRLARRREVKSCSTCAKAKVKCEIEYRSDKCKRCQRLDKDCVGQTPGSHTRKRASLLAYSREDIARLESKVDSVSQHLATLPLPSGPYTGATLSPSPSRTTPINRSLETILPDVQDATAFLDLYRNEMAPLFPFVIIPPHITATRLQEQKPILFKAIMMVACQFDTSRQLKLAILVREEIAQAVMVRAEKSLELLQALLVCLTWNHIHVQLGNQLFNYLHIAIAMIMELGLNKEPYVLSRTAAGALRDLGETQVAGPIRTLDEKRAFLGVFCMTCITKTCLREVDGLRPTEYVENCRRSLEGMGEYPSDQFLSQLVRLEQKVEKISQILYSDGAPCPMHASLAMGISSLEKEILEAKPDIRNNTQQASIGLLTYYSVSIYLYKIGLDDHVFPSTQATNTFSSPSYDMLRLHLLSSCLETIRNLDTLSFTLSVNEYFSVPYFILGQQGHALLILSRLSDIRFRTWDAAYVSSILDPKAVYRQTAFKLGEAMLMGRKQNPPRFMPEIFGLLIEKLEKVASMQKSLGEGANETSCLDSEVVADAFMSEEEIMNGFFDFFDFGFGV